ncbi:hypothetical protein [Aestuariimicrobium ganziense]|uniref:hypothetical protein n=1 Tax=Aestuariimicrobium ganziense TaxID=2773677 RepID=UPI0019408709|nr:hypothetical protein [Aestuariimicrobium ganziense]
MSLVRTDSLTEPLTAGELQELKQRRRRGDFGPQAGVRQLVLGALAVVFLGTVTATGVGQVADVVRHGHWNLFGVVWLLALASMVFALVRRLTPIGGWRAWAKLARFADHNGLTYRMRSADPSYPGLLFNLGHSRASTHHIWAPQGVLADVGGYTYATGSGKHRKDFEWHFAAFRLPRRLPHLLLDAKSNNMAGFSNLPVVFAANQRVSMGAPFDDDYTLYAPEGYGLDAFYLFGPHVIERLVQAQADYDIEIVDDWMFLYTRQRQDLTDPATWQLFQGIADEVLSRFSRVAQRYHDQRVEGLATGVLAAAAAADARRASPGRPAVAPQGQRLRNGLDLRTVIVVGAMVGLWVLLQVLR